MPYKDKSVQRAKNKEYQRKHYKENPAYYKNKAAKRKKSIRNYFTQYKQSLGCSSCSENHPSCLDFHHPDSTDKENSVSRMITNGVAMYRIKAEVEKCVVLCSNCHRKLHS